MKQVGKQLTDHVGGFLLGKKYLIMARDEKFASEFQMVLKDVGVETFLLPPKSPNLNAYAEWFVRSIKEECLDNQLIEPVDDIDKSDGEIVCRERLGGMLRFYYRHAA